MNGKFKFRVWDTRYNRYFEPTYEAYKGNLSELLISMSGNVIHRTINQTSLIDHQEGRWILEQFTGLYDKNGKEIYEGDILVSVFHLNRGYPNYAPIVFENGAFTWHGEPLVFDEEDFKVIAREWSVVAGNIHENPELL